MKWREWLLRSGAPVATGVSDDKNKRSAEAAENLAVPAARLTKPHPGVRASFVENARTPLEKVRAALQVLTERGVAHPEQWYVEKALHTFLEDVPARVFSPSGSRFARWIKETQDFAAREDPLRMFVLLQYLTRTSPDDQSPWSLECERLMRRVLIEMVSTLDIRAWVLGVEKKWMEEGLILCRVFFEWIEEQLAQQEEVQTFVRNHELLLGGLTQSASSILRALYLNDQPLAAISALSGKSVLDAEAEIAKAIDALRSKKRQVFVTELREKITQEKKHGLTAVDSIAAPEKTRGRRPMGFFSFLARPNCCDFKIA